MLLACCLTVGCNRYHTPQTIDPVAELRMSEKSIAIGARTLKIPRGWAVDMLARFDEKERPLTVFLERPNAHMRFEVVKEPLWRGNVDVYETSTTAYRSVMYKVISTQQPSGDDTPASYMISAYVKKGSVFWCMEAVFATPVRPDLVEAIKYIDAIVPQNEGE